MPYLCPQCHGLGVTLDDETCPTCNGFKVVAYSGGKCPHCNGSGKDPDNKVYSCGKCRGKGYLPGEEYRGSENLTDSKGQALGRPSLLYVDTKHLRSALENILAGKWQDSFEYGFLAGLVASGVEDLREESLEEKQKWVDSLIKRGELIVDYDSVWSIVDGVGVRVHKFRLVEPLTSPVKELLERQ